MKTCAKCQNDFEISAEDKAFIKKIAPEIGDTKFTIPEPNFCPNCRVQRRMTWRNDRNLYERKCDLSGEKLISMFAPDSKVKVMHKDLWYGDKWDGRKYGKDFDFKRTFFEQFNELLQQTLLPHIMIHSDSNSLYTNYTYANKNCYLCFAGNHLEDSLYCYNAENSRDCIDCLFIFDSELCYELVHSSNCYNIKFSLHCRGCKDSAFLEDCTNCSNCFMCWNLNGQEYCFMNKKYSKEEYEKVITNFSLKTKAHLQKAVEQWNQERKKHPKPENHNISAENCNGEYILNSKNCHDSYIISKNCEDCRHIVNGFPGLKDSLDCTYSGENTSLLYECTASGADCYNMAFCNLCFVNCSNLYYCSIVSASKNCFGCISLRNSEYCILNKQYTKEEHEKLVPQIIEHMKQTGEWGEFYPSHLSPFGYNETLAQDFFPLSQEQAKQQQFQWREESQKKYQEQNYNGSYDIQETNDNIINELLACNECAKNFKITPQELNFYKKINIAIPSNCFDCRHKRRLSIRNPYGVWHRKCDNCNNKISTSYKTANPQKVFCKNCYLKEVY
jgi:hypothetical protein